MLSRLIYTSRSKTPLPLDLKDILSQSRANNPKRDITGALAFLDGVYLQYLEGDSEVLKEVYAKIQADPRHRDPRVLEQSPIAARQFADWSMGLVTWDDETRELFKRCAYDRGDGTFQMDPGRSAEFFLALTRKKNWLTV